MSNLRSHLNELADSFASGVLAAIRSASIDDLLAESGASKGRRARGANGGGEPLSTSRKRGRLPRRSPEQIAEALERVVAAVKAKDGMRAEDIRETLRLDRRELPRVLQEGLQRKMLRATGQKRATTYFAARGGGTARNVKAPKKRAKAARKK